jgi:hypothetical protein
MVPAAAAGALALLAVLAPGASVAAAAPATSPRATVDMTFSTREAGSPAGFSYSAEFRDPDDPNATPPPLRRLVITAPSGAWIDTSVPARCDATDEELKRDGASACPDDSVIGAGSALTKPILFPQLSYESVIFNAADQQVQLLTSDPPAPPTVVRGYFNGKGIESTIPTCLNGGAPPDDCPSDQASLIRNELTVAPYTIGEGRARRTYFVTPMLCPRSGLWESVVAFYYGDGVQETLTPTQPCVPARTRVRVRPRRVPVGEATKLKCRAFARLGGVWTPLAGARLRIGKQAAATGGAGRATFDVRFLRAGRRHVRLTRAGMRPSRAAIRARPGD